MPKPVEHSNEPIVLAAIAPNYTIAEMWQEMLDEAGIRCMVKALGAGSALTATVTLQHAIYVLQSDLARAREIVEDSGAEDEP